MNILGMSGGLLNTVVSYIVFFFLDLLDFMLCYVYRITDLIMEAEWKPCYCSSSSKETMKSSRNIVVSQRVGESRLVRFITRLKMEDISDTLYTRPSTVSDVSKYSFTTRQSSEKKKKNPYRRLRSAGTYSYTVDSAIVEMLQGTSQASLKKPIPRWSDCHCHSCLSCNSASEQALFVKAGGALDNAQEDVVFIHGFISSSSFWTETLYPNFSKSATTKYRFLAMDLLGFGRSPKPADSFYTLRDHLDMIEQSVLEQYKVKSFHLVAHSLGCILALALAVKHADSVKSLTLLAPPYFPAPEGEPATQYMMRRIGPRRVWPLITFGASIACRYEHIGRSICLLICKNHRFWEYIVQKITRNRIKMYILEGFFLHTHSAAWHTLHNIICGTAAKMDGWLAEVKNRLKCSITVFHGRDDELIPVECSYSLQKRIPRAHVRIIDKRDHIAIVVGREKAFARELERIWKN